MHALLQKATLILIGLAMVIGSSLLAPAMGQVAAEFPAASPALLPLMITLPALTLLAGLVISSALSSRIALKTLILIGLALILVGGVLPAFIPGLTLIIILRGILGVGLGMIMPLQTALIAEYSEKERTALIGNNVAINCVLAVVFFAIAGKLAEINWRYIFFLYGVFALIMLMAIIYIPRRPSSAAMPDAASTAHRRRLPLSVFIYCFFIALVTLTGYVMTTIMANYLGHYHLGGASEVGLLTALATAVSAIGGVLVPQISRLCRNYAVPILILCCAAGFFCYTQTASLAFITVGHGLTGFAQGVLGCILTFKLTQVVPLEQVSIASSCYLATVFICQFLSPYWLWLHKAWLRLPDDCAVYVVYTIVLLLLSAFAFFWMHREDKIASRIPPHAPDAPAK